jgi:proline iminopeptidase
MASSSTTAAVPPRDLYPPIEPYNTGFLQVSELHNIYYEQVGQAASSNAQAAVVVHGGPGGGISPFYRQFFDPDHYRVVLFDQRGAGQSTPHAELRGTIPTT